MSQGGYDPDEIIYRGQGPGMTRREYDAWGKRVEVAPAPIHDEPHYGFQVKPDLTNEEIWQAAVTFAKLLEGQVIPASEYEAYRRVKDQEWFWAMYVVQPGASESIAEHRAREGAVR